MNPRRQMLISAALLGAAGALQLPGLLRGVQRSAADFPWPGLISAALILGAALGTLLHALWPLRGERPVRDWRASLPFYLLPTLALLLGGALLIDRELTRDVNLTARTAFDRSARDLELTMMACPVRGDRCVQANVDGPLMADLLHEAVTAAGGRVEGGVLPLTRQGDRVVGEARVTLRAGLRQVPFTLRYEGPVIVGRAAPLPDAALPLAQATLERADD
ncbi:hypothetical protein [Deinococcus actinosclerus]|uniref:DUF4131 domain-containing protein n=1 Tax=Deinococcus actinosclerus TaxID=1768108 RepID=A0ABM5X8G9_9DEIO|nr:hypothetical protein [Deinococcus actinosclerus]ALW89977.1 hypothetical protein AUC44_14635 [Deinococcus actinosclerus]